MTPEPESGIDARRRAILGYFTAAGLGATLFPGALAAFAEDAPEITVDMVASAERVAGLVFTAQERETLVKRLMEYAARYDAMRAVPITNDIPPAVMFNPFPHGSFPPKKSGSPSG